MRYHIIATTDDQFLGEEFEDTFPITLDGNIFEPDGPMETLGDGVFRFSNSNYCIDAKEITGGKDNQ